MTPDNGFWPEPEPDFPGVVLGNGDRVWITRYFLSYFSLPMIRKTRTDFFMELTNPRLLGTLEENPIGDAWEKGMLPDHTYQMHAIDLDGDEEFGFKKGLFEVSNVVHPSSCDSQCPAWTRYVPLR